MTDTEVLSKVFLSADLFRIPRPVLLKTLASSIRKNGALYLELFCADPQHPIFIKEQENTLAPMRLERLRRFRTTQEHFKTRQCTRAKDKTCPHKCGHHKPHQRNASCKEKAETCGECE
jgi:hypothetical protein